MHGSLRRGWAAAIALAVVPAAFVMGAVPAAATPPDAASGGGGEHDAALAFDPGDYTTISVTIDGAPTDVRWYREICYVADPVLMAASQPLPPFAYPNPAEPNPCGFQSMNIYVPESAFDDADTAIYLGFVNSGWFASYVPASVTDGASFDSATSNVGAALKAGYVYADVGTRSRQVVGADGAWPGKAPAAVVDAKAAVRYLRLNNAALPGSAERIVANGTSGGGAQVSALGASGNSRDYLPYLAEIGAAGIDAKGRSTLRDDVFAVNAYCPITDLGHADISYEWLYSVLGTRSDVTAFDSDKWPDATTALAAAYPAYQKSLNLREADGSRLTADTMLSAIEGEVIRSAEFYMSADPANVISGYDWIEVDNDNDTVLSVDMAAYLLYVANTTQLKPAPAFDQTGVTVPNSGGGPGQGESNLFGTASQEYSNFTEWAWNHNGIAGGAGDGVGLDDTGLTWDRFIRLPDTTIDEQLRLINPMEFIGTNADTAPYWYVRVGALDRDTAFTVSVNLDRALVADKSVRDVDYRLAWNTGHAGNYDVPEAMQWIDAVLSEAG